MLGGRFTLQGVLDSTLLQAAGINSDGSSAPGSGAPRGAWGSAGGVAIRRASSSTGRSPKLAASASASGAGQDSSPHGSPPLPAMSLGTAALLDTNLVPGLALLERATSDASRSDGRTRGASSGSAGSMLWVSDMEDPGRHLLRAVRGAAPMAPARLVTPPGLVYVVPQAPPREDGLEMMIPLRPGSMRSLSDPHCDAGRINGSAAAWIEAAVATRQMMVEAVAARLAEAARLGGTAQAATGSVAARRLAGVPLTARESWPRERRTSRATGGARGAGSALRAGGASRGSAFDAMASLLDPQANARRRSGSVEGGFGAGAPEAGGEGGGLLQRAASSQVPEAGAGAGTGAASGEGTG